MDTKHEKSPKRKRQKPKRSKGQVDKPSKALRYLEEPEPIPLKAARVKKEEDTTSKQELQHQAAKDAHRDPKHVEPDTPSTSDAWTDAELLEDCPSASQAVGLITTQLKPLTLVKENTTDRGPRRPSEAQGRWSRDVLILPDPPARSGIVTNQFWQGDGRFAAFKKHDIGLNAACRQRLFEDRDVEDRLPVLSKEGQIDDATSLTKNDESEMQKTLSPPTIDLTDLTESKKDAPLSPDVSTPETMPSSTLSSTIAGEVSPTHPDDPSSSILRGFMDLFRPLVMEEIQQAIQVSILIETPQTSSQTTQTETESKDRRGRLKDKSRERRRVKRRETRNSQSLLKKMQKAQEAEDKKNEEKRWRSMTVSSRTTTSTFRLNPAANQFIPKGSE